MRSRKTCTNSCWAANSTHRNINLPFWDLRGPSRQHKRHKRPTAQSQRRSILLPEGKSARQSSSKWTQKAGVKARERRRGFKKNDFNMITMQECLKRPNKWRLWGGWKELILPPNACFMTKFMVMAFLFPRLPYLSSVTFTWGWRVEVSPEGATKHHLNWMWLTCLSTRGF